jgi:hypothetical protein
MKPAVARVVKTTIIAFWLVMLGLLVERTYLRPASVIALDIITEEGIRTGDEWFGIYQQGRKIGYAHVRMALEGDAYRISEESELDILVLGKVRRVRTAINSYASKNFLLKYFDFAMTSEVTNMQVKGSVIRKQLVLDITTGGQTRKERIPLKEPPYLSPNIKPAIVLLGLEQGKRYRFPLFNPATMSTEDAFVTIEAKESIKVGEEQVTVYRLRESFQGMEAVSWVTQDGSTIKEESALGYVLLKETPVEARKLDKEGPVVDIIALTKIPSDPVANSEAVTSLRARLSGAPLAKYALAGDRQSISGNVVEVRALPPQETYRLPYRGKDLAEHLAPNALVQSDDGRIVDEMKRILGGEKDAAAAAKKISEWVYNALQKKPVVSIPSALEILNQRVGDCNEHTTLYAALARAAGIPTRMAAGIVYMHDGFYYHAWPEVWLGAWVAVDPTFNQFPADATHIRFVTGSLDRQSEILGLVGKLKVEVLEYKDK